MFSLTFKKKGKPVAYVRGGKYGGKIISIVENENFGKVDREIPVAFEKLIKHPLLDKYKTKREKLRKLEKIKKFIMRNEMRGSDSEDEFDSDEEYESDDEELMKNAFKVTDDMRKKEIFIYDGKLEIIPTTEEGQRDSIYLSGPSGSGKSTCIATYARMYKKMFPNNKIYIFSRLDSDDVLDDLNPIRIIINQDIIDDPIDPNELADSIVIFDDTDTIKDKDLKKAVIDLKDDILETGRHCNINVCICSHMMSNWKATRLVLAESTMIIGFPQMGTGHQFNKVMREQFGMVRKEVQKVNKLQSRWVALAARAPRFVMYEHGIYLL